MIQPIFKIMGKHNGQVEELDTTVGNSNAKSTVKNFQYDLGKEWEIWAEEVKPANETQF